MHKAEPIYDGADPNPDHVIAWSSDASENAVEFVLDQAIDDDGRSEFRWLRLANGDLWLGVLPRGATYERVSEGDAAMDYPADPEPDSDESSREPRYWIIDNPDADEPSLPEPASARYGAGPFLVPICDERHGGVIAWANTVEQANRIVAALGGTANAKPSYSCEFVFYGDDRIDALENRIIAALEVEGLDFDPLTVNVEKISDNQEDANA